MKEKGWKQSDKGVDKRFGDYLTFKNGTYATRKIDGYNYITFYFYEEYFYMSDLFFNVEKK